MLDVWHERERARRTTRASGATAQRMRGRLERERALYPWNKRRILLLAVAAEFGLDADDLTGPRRFKPLIEARCAFAAPAAQQLSASTTQIGQTLGMRDHTTAINLRQGAESRAAADAAFAGRLAAIAAILAPEMRA